MTRLKHLEIYAYAIFFFGMWRMVALDEYNSNDDPDSEAEWLYFIDDGGNTHVMNFSSLPREVVYGDVYFSLYTRKNTDNPELLKIPKDNTQFNSTYFTDLKPIVVIAHGWYSDDKMKWVRETKNSFLKKHEMNVITVDWGELAKNPAYPLSAMCTRYVGKKLAKLLNIIIKTYGVEGKDIHLLGHSLGAQVMGYTGMFSNQRIQRITGLDPARPLFEIPFMPSDFRLDKSDAEFVDIIHTCGGIFGYKLSHGHADFYPNKGKAPQPGCQGIRQKIQACSHGRSCQYFEESIRHKPGHGFVAYPCEMWEGNDECRNNSGFMGYPATGCMGDYYLRTRNESDFAIYDD